MTPLATQIAALPIIQQIEIMQEVANAKSFGALSFALTERLDSILAALHRDAIDQAAAENDALHGKEVSMLEPAWVSPCGMGVGY